ncbi:hypothetical protein FRC17_008513, partial [Serendipita sp. 399]
MASQVNPSSYDRKGPRSVHSTTSSQHSGGMSSNVVDHLAPGVTEHHPSPTTNNNTLTAHTARRINDGKIITVQPLKKDEMQPSYAQDLGVGVVTHGLYGSCLNGLGSIIGAI